MHWQLSGESKARLDHLDQMMQTVVDQSAAQAQLLQTLVNQSAAQAQLLQTLVDQSAAH
jgi:hypothetical protein